MSGPGRSHRAGLSWPQFFARFPDDATATAWLAAVRWGSADQPSYCPRCGSCDQDRLRATPAGKPLPYWCGACRRHFSVQSQSVMHRSRLGAQQWVLALYLLTTSLKGVSSMKLHRDLAITQKSAWFLAHRLRAAFAAAAAPPPFAGPVEVDETYIGGKRKNMHARKRKQLTGRGAVGKATVVGARDRTTGRVVAQHVALADRQTLHAFVADHTAPAGTVYTDDGAAYRRLPFPHAVVNHSAGEYVRDQAHINGIESFWAVLKRAYTGTFHHFSHRHLDRYATEFAGRHNLRDLDTLDQMELLALGMFACRLTYRQLIGKDSISKERLRSTEPITVVSDPALLDQPY